MSTTLRDNSSGRAVVIGAGPAGLSAAHELTAQGLQPIVYEKDGLVGGISRTQNYKGFHFDMGGIASSQSRRKSTRCGALCLGTSF